MAEALNICSLSPEEAILRAQEDVNQFAFIDVRSEKEFARSHVPGFTNIPILNDEFRHMVGLKYHRQGNAEAIKLGHELVQPHQFTLLSKWGNQIQASILKQGILTCWRGGLRSRIASEWLSENKCSVLRVEGGYKAMRRLLLQSLDSSPECCVLTGLTGSGKTQLLRGLKAPVLDLERFADHRGSSFGGYLNRPPVSQCVFENSIALNQFGKLNRRVVVEDESRYVGRCMIPNPLFHQMKTAPMVQMKIPIEDRIQNIHLEYVKRPLDAGTPSSSLLSSLKKSSLALNQSLGSDRLASVIKSLDLAFATDSPTSSHHHDWISILLVHHYDPAYRRSLQKSISRITFQGNTEECRQYIETEFDS